jgi:hypothetical protein
MLVDRLTRARLAVRAINEQYLQVVAAKLADQESGRFRRAVLAEAYPSIYRPTLGEEAFEAVGKLTGLNADQLAAIEALRTDYDTHLAEINQRLMRTIRAQQPKRLRESIEHAIAVTEGSDDPIEENSEVRDTITDDFRRRQQLDARTMRSLYGLLRPEQLAGLPSIPEIDLAEPITSEHADETLDSDDE